MLLETLKILTHLIIDIEDTFLYFSINFFSSIDKCLKLWNILNQFWTYIIQRLNAFKIKRKKYMRPLLHLRQSLQMFPWKSDHAHVRMPLPLLSSPLVVLPNHCKIIFNTIWITSQNDWIIHSPQTDCFHYESIKMGTKWCGGGNMETLQEFQTEK